MSIKLSLYVFLSGALILLLTQCSQPQAVRTIDSPSGTLSVSVYADSNGRLTYSVDYLHKTLLCSSPLGIQVDGQDLGKDIAIASPAISMSDETYPLLGGHDTAHNHYREAVFAITQKRSKKFCELEIRVFDDGMAYRYWVPATGVSTVQGEASAWKIPEGSGVWYQENIFYYEGLYYQSPLNKLGSRRMGPPLTYQTGDSLYGCITEAALHDYSGMSLQSDSQGIVHAAFVNDPKGWDLRDTVVSPWRVLLAGRDLNQLVQSDIISDLNPAPSLALQQARWIKPGRAVWSYFMHDNVTTLDLEKSYVDKAGRLGFEYSVVDAGWEGSWPSCMDSLRDLVNYGKPKNVGIWVWKSYQGLRDDSVRQHFFKELHAAGVAGVKIDFIDTEGIRQVRFYQRALEDAAAEKLMIDFHGADKPTGYNRTFPNELTREAIYGQEWRTYNPQGPAHNATLPFTRFLAGPADATPGVFDSRKAYGTSRAQQLALPIIFLSPLACWPEDPEVYLRSPALPIIQAMPTVWDETKVLPFSRIGQVAAFARRRGNDWFIAIANAGEERRIKIPLSFLGPGQYKTDIAADDLHDPDHLLASRIVSTAADSLNVVMRPAGGYVAMLRKTDGHAPGLVLSPDAGYLYLPIKLNMKARAGLTIRYSSDGSEPNSGSTLFTQAIELKKPALIRAAVFDGNSPLDAFATAQFLLPPGPKPSVPAGLFIGDIVVGLDAGQPAGLIHYTKDGSEPLASSPVYRDSIHLKKAAVIKAKTFYEGGMASATSTAKYENAILAPPLSERPTASGLRADYYEGPWKRMPDFSRMKPLRTTPVEIPDLDQLKTAKSQYAVRFDGYIRIAVTGVYHFFISSDDGSQLDLDDRQLIDNDGTHGDLEKSGEKALAAGLHRISIKYFQDGSGQSLAVYISGEGMKKQLIPAGFFYH